MRTLLLPLLVTVTLAACRPAPADPAPSPSPSPAAEAPAPSPAPSCAARASSPALRPLDTQGAGSTVALAHAGPRTVALAADEDDAALHLVDLDTRAVLGTTPLAGKPAQLLVTQDGRVIVALRDENALEVLEPDSGPAAPLARRCLVETPAEPVGLALTPDGKTLLAVSRWGHALTVFGAEQLERRFQADLPRDPQSVLPSADGRRAFVTHVAGNVISVVELDAPAPPAPPPPGGVASARFEYVPPRPTTPVVRALPLRTRHSAVVHMGMMLMMPRKNKPAREKPRTEQHERVGDQGFSLVRSGEGRILAPLTLLEPRPPIGASSGYGSSSESSPAVVGEVAVLDEAKETLDFAPAGQGIGPTDCFLPRAAALDPERHALLVACMGIDAVVAYDAGKKHPHAYAQRHIRVPAGPTGIALDLPGQRAVVFSQFEGALSVFPLNEIGVAKNGEAAERISIPAHHGLPAELAEGRRLFHASGRRTVAFDGRACASCHPEGRDDGLTWTTQEGPRQTPMLMGRLEGSAPYGWLGDKGDLPSHFARTLERLGGTGLVAKERDAIFAWVRSLKAPEDPTAEAAARLSRGKEIFFSAAAGCGGCHLGDLGTDGERHDVGSRNKIEAEKRFDTPSLRFVARSAPYFHDGRYATLADMLAGTDGTMGSTKELSAQDLDALMAYVTSL